MVAKELFLRHTCTRFLFLFSIYSVRRFRYTCIIPTYNRLTFSPHETDIRSFSIDYLVIFIVTGFP